MEDRHTISARLNGNPAASLYAVFDGHAGSIAAEFCSERVTSYLTSNEHFPASAPAAAPRTGSNSNNASTALAPPSRTPPSTPSLPRTEGASAAAPALSLESRVVRALTQTFQKLDAHFLEIASGRSLATKGPGMGSGAGAGAGAYTFSRPLDDGCTALAMVVLGGSSPNPAPTLYVANAGDSRAVLVRRSHPPSSSSSFSASPYNITVEPLSEDHKPNRPDEIARIKAAGGTVLFHGVWRVSGVLAVSRAIGDRLLKPYVTATPDVIYHTVVPGQDMAVVLATDGVWDVYSNGEVGALVAACEWDAVKAAEAIVQGALARGSADNVTAIVVDLTRPSSSASSSVSAPLSSGGQTMMGPSVGGGGGGGGGTRGTGGGQRHCTGSEGAPESSRGWPHASASYVWPGTSQEQQQQQW